MTYARFALPALTALLAGCATVPTAETPPDPMPTATYMALGTEPFWNLEVTPTRLNFIRPGEPRMVADNPGWQRATSGTTGEPAGRVIAAAGMTIIQRAGPCSDGMSERRYNDRVVVHVGGMTFIGCGGGEMQAPAASLERSGWRITAVNGRPAAAGIEADLNFADGRVTGSAGCNRLTGPYTQERNRLTFGAIAATRMACMGPGGEQENTVFAILRQPLTISFGEWMTMTWTAPDGSSIALRRLDWD